MDRGSCAALTRPSTKAIGEFMRATQGLRGVSLLKPFLRLLRQNWIRLAYSALLTALVIWLKRLLTGG